VAGGYGEPVAEAIGGAVEEIADSQLQQRPAYSASVAEGAKILFNGHSFCF
jgi:hypothetical protein